MAKRFTDSAKWDDPWFSELPSKYKLFYLYLLDECDHAGVWKVNFRKANFMVGETLEPSEVRRFMSDRVRVIDEAYWHVTKFIKFQYGMLRNDRMSLSALAILEKHGLTDIVEEAKEAPSKPLPSPFVGVKDKDKDKDMDMVKEEEGKNRKTHERPTIEQCVQASQMKGFSAKQGEAYFHFRERDGWTTVRGKEGNRFPIENWTSDLVHCISKGYVDKDVKPTNETANKPYYRELT